MSATRILGVCGTQRKDSNCERCLAEALKAGSAVGGVETELVSLSGLHINHCDGCRRCHYKGTKRRPCPSYDDDMTPLYAKIAESDGFIFVSPVYFGSVSSTMKVFMDRTLPFTNGYYCPDTDVEFKETLRFRPAGGIAVGGSRNDGIETTLSTFYRFFLYHDMVAVGAQVVGNVSASALGGTIFSDEKPDALKRDNIGASTIQATGRKVAILAKTLKTFRADVKSSMDIKA